MKTNRITRGKAIFAVMLALIVAAGFMLVSRDTYAAGGTVTVNVANQGSWPESTEFTFNLYKVGDYDHDSSGNAIFKLDSKYADAGVDLSDASIYKYDDGKEEKWTEDWLKRANTLATYINGMESGKPTSLGEQKATFGATGNASFSYSVTENGLYLLVGNAEEVGDYLWTPQSMFISVLNGDKTIQFDNSLGVKLVSRKIVFEYNVIKNWIGDTDSDISDLVRPEKIAVKIMYGSTKVDTVILTSANNYKFSWKHKKLSDDATQITYYPEGDTTGKVIDVNKDDAGWSVIELRDGDEIRAIGSDDAKDAAAQSPRLRYYTTTYISKEINDETESFTIENEFSCKYIKLRKTIDGYDDDGSNVTFSFKIVGYDAAGNEIYTNHAGVSFARQDGLTKEVIINYIPGAVETIKVDEEYKGNYELVGKIEVSPLYESTDTGSSQGDGGESGDTAGTGGSGDNDGSGDSAEAKKLAGWEVAAVNKHGNHGPKGGIVNRYDHDKAPAQDPGSDPSSDNTQGQ